MADAVAIVSVVTSGAITPAIVAGYALHRQRQQQLETRRDELRNVLDSAAEQAGRARRRLEFVHTAWRDGLNPEDPAIRDRATEWRDTLEGPRFAVDRLSIRLAGNDPTNIIATYETFLTSLDRYRRALEPFYDGEPYDGATVSQARSQALTLRRDFLQAAFLRVGMKRSETSPLWSTLPLEEDRY